MRIYDQNIAIEDIQDTVRMHSPKYGIATMYVKERSDFQCRSLEMILVSKEDALRISAHLPDNSYASLTPEFPSANVHEREILEMSNVLPLGHSDLRPLKLRKRSDDHYPMKKTKNTFPLSQTVLIPRNGIVGEGLFEIPVGPIHAGVIEPGHFRFSVAGEPILMMRTYLGYTYRGIEKMMETPVDKDNIKIAERISGDNAVAHSLAYLHTIEGDTEIPIRARYIRTIYAELERIYYMLNGISGVALDTALSVAAAKGYGMKEQMLRLNERISGDRMLRGMLKRGGLRKDMDDNAAKDIEKVMLQMKFDIDELFELMISSPSFMDRAEKTGVLKNETVKKLRIVGPAARASGEEYDVRKDHPYEAYGRIGMRVPVQTIGDVYARLEVKTKEALESISIVTQCLNDMEPGEISCDVKTEDGFSMGLVESPRGELIHCMHVINGNIWRYKIRDPSFPNWPALEHAVSGNIVPDFPLINKSFDLSYSGNDL